ncbi:two pore domain potassium channel family protein [Candidatus Saccharibacteria bacterium]|nr:two pore domain potassium channel family protein [Candidatus Saccharibacteria bacterium]
MQAEFNRHAYRILLASALITLGTGVIVYHFVEKLPWVDAYYFSVITLTTVGYGDISPQTTFGKLFTTFYILVGVGIISAFVTQFLKRQAFRVQSRNQTKESSEK